MAKEKAITRDDLVDLLAEFYHDRLRPEFEKVNSRLGRVEGQLNNMEGRLAGVEKRLTAVEAELKGVKNDIKGLTGEFSDTPSRKEFKNLEGKVDRFHPTS